MLSKHRRTNDFVFSLQILVRCRPEPNHLFFVCNNDISWYVPAHEQSDQFRVGAHDIRCLEIIKASHSRDFLPFIPRQSKSFSSRCFSDLRMRLSATKMLQFIPAGVNCRTVIKTVKLLSGHQLPNVDNFQAFVQPIWDFMAVIFFLVPMNKLCIRMEGRNVCQICKLREVSPCLTAHRNGFSNAHRSMNSHEFDC